MTKRWQFNFNSNLPSDDTLRAPSEPFRLLSISNSAVRRRRNVKSSPEGELLIELPSNTPRGFRFRGGERESKLLAADSEEQQSDWESKKLR